MTVPRILKGSLGAALVAILAIAGFTVFAPVEVCAGECQFDWWTVNEWGMASTCTGAINACNSRAVSAADAECAAINKGLCATGTFTHNTCYLSGGQWKVDCSLQYKCDGGPDIPD